MPSVVNPQLSQHIWQSGHTVTGMCANVIEVHVADVVKVLDANVMRCMQPIWLKEHDDDEIEVHDAGVTAAYDAM